MANGKFWEQAATFFDGVAGVTNSIEGVTGSLADNAENVARGQSAIWDARQTKDERTLDMQLERYKVLRGDNVQLYWAGAAVAGLVILLLVK